MKVSKFESADMHPLEQAIREQQTQESNFRRRYNEAWEFLRQAEQRQENRHREIEAMLDELDTEEVALRKQVREDTSRRATARINGQKPPEGICEAGARLAAIPDQRAALQSLARIKEMTAEEKEKWEAIYSELSDVADSLEEQEKTVIALLLQWSRYFDSEYRGASLSLDSGTLDTLLRKAYGLNSHPEEDEHEEE